MRTDWNFEDSLESCKQHFKNKEEFKKFMLKSEDFNKAYYEAREKNNKITLESYLDDFYEKTQKLGKLIGLI